MLKPYQRYADFNGRSTRSEYWLFILFTFIVYFVCGILQAASKSLADILVVLFGLASFVPSLAVAIRRLHDTDRSGWNLLWAFLPIIGTIVFIVFMCLPSTPASNRFGPPEGAGSVADYRETFS